MHGVRDHPCSGQATRTRETTGFSPNGADQTRARARSAAPQDLLKSTLLRGRLGCARWMDRGLPFRHSWQSTTSTAGHGREGDILLRRRVCLQFGSLSCSRVGDAGWLERLP